MVMVVEGVANEVEEVVVRMVVVLEVVTSLGRHHCIALNRKLDDGSKEGVQNTTGREIHSLTLPGLSSVQVAESLSPTQDLLFYQYSCGTANACTANACTMLVVRCLCWCARTINIYCTHQPCFPRHSRLS